MPELTLRDAMVLIGSLLILAVIVDAWRRMRKQQRSRVRLNLNSEVPSDAPADDLAMFRELPNGGARVVGRDDEELAAEIANAVAGIPVNEVDVAKRVESPVRKPLGPVGRTVAPDPRDQSESSGKLLNDESPELEQSESDAPETRDEEHEAADELDAMAGVSARDDEPANLDWLEDLPDPNQSSQDDDAGELPRDADSEVIVLHVISRQDLFAGKDILEILLACDLRFGDMSFFHRHEQQAGRGAIQFSVANMMQPGVFDIDNMDAMRAKGLVFFVTLPGPEDMIQAFDYMLETARVVARNLNGELLDQSRSVLTQQAVEHSRQQIRELERRLLAKDR